MYNKRYYVTVHMYPHGYDDALGLPQSTFAVAHAPKVVTIALGAQTTSVVSLWPSIRIVSRDSVTYRFVQL